MSFNITIDGAPVEVTAGETVLSAARRIGLDIPTLCYLEKCGPLNSCQVCLVKTNGKLVPSCGTKVQPGMEIESETVEVHEARRTALELLFSDHVGDCLSPCHRLCPLRMNIPVMIRHIQAARVEEAVTTVRDALPLPAVLGRLCHHPCEQGCRRASWDDPAAIRSMERLAADWDLGIVSADAAPAGPPDGPRFPRLPSRKTPTGRSVVIIGSGPCGLTAAYNLLREGHACTLADRRAEAGGTLRTQTNETTLPRVVLDAEIDQLKRLGAQFQFGIELGRDLSLEGLLRGFDAVLLAVGEVSTADSHKLGLEIVTTGIKANPDTCQTQRPAVFAAGRAVKPLNQLVRAMSDGQAAAECIHRFLSGQKIARRDRPFSSIMGRLEKSELAQFAKSASPAKKVSPCDMCAGFKPSEGAAEASRCLHCDCRSSGDCALQTYAQIYEADASRYRQQRRPFEQHLQPGGIIFEPGKCILCGICVKLTDLAREPLGLTFIGRGFDVRVSSPFNNTIEAGLQKVAAECVEHCPTGALTHTTC
jgi:ferredoxin